MAQAPKKIFLIRLDKIGDLICTLCVDQASFLKDHDVQWALAKGLGFIAEAAEPPRRSLELSKDDWKKSLATLREFLRHFQPDIAVSFQAPWWVHYALWVERVPMRAGVLSQWHSFLFLNKGLRQKRSHAVQHEAAYNMDLLCHALGEPPVSNVPVLKLQASPNPELLKTYGLKEKNYVVVHPGMAGSALNWPLPSYRELIEKILPVRPVVLTGTPADEPWLKDIREHFKNDARVINLQGKLKGPELFTVLKEARAVVVPSTGVAHMAASLGTPVIGLYSPLKVQHPRRWAPRSPQSSVHILLPALGSQQDNDSAENIMSQISVKDVFSSLQAYL